MSWGGVGGCSGAPEPSGAPAAAQSANAAISSSVRTSGSRNSPHDPSEVTSHGGIERCAVASAIASDQGAASDHSVRSIPMPPGWWQVAQRAVITGATSSQVVTPGRWGRWGSGVVDDGPTVSWGGRSSQANSGIHHIVTPS